jgi:hypothetical protein
MVVSGQLQDTGHLAAGEGAPLVPIVTEDGWGPGPVWMLCQESNPGSSCRPALSLTASVRTFVIIPYLLLCMQLAFIL